jgi:predicted phosphodiesterase
MSYATGLVVNRPEPIVVDPGSIVGLTLMSDLHIGASMVDYDLLLSDLDEADRNGDRILINGDLIDGIVPGDKRFSPERVHPRVRGRSDMVAAEVEWAVDLLRPYAHLIDVIGVGNHDTHVERVAKVDPVKMILKDLGEDIRYGGYTGVVEYTFQYHDNPRRVKKYRIFAHHGSGKQGTLRASMDSLQRKRSWVQADMIWEGHSHTRWSAVERNLSWSEKDSVPILKPVRFVVTGSYIDPYVAQSEDSIKRHGRRGNYVSDSGLAPHGNGGARVLFEVGNRAEPLRVKVVQ